MIDLVLAFGIIIAFYLGISYFAKNYYIKASCFFMATLQIMTMYMEIYNESIGIPPSMDSTILAVNATVILAFNGVILFLTLLFMILQMMQVDKEEEAVDEVKWEPK